MAAPTLSDATAGILPIHAIRRERCIFSVYIGKSGSYSTDQQLGACAEFCGLIRLTLELGGLRSIASREERISL
jgi:hypothetical protein